jgi:carbonic anhydrase/acetyltransferase-like protein (isoleucine patch superfamily)
MAIIRTFENKTPKIGNDTFVAETAVVIGDVEVGSRSSLWYGVVLRGDVHHIRIGDDVSVQDNTVVHVTSGRHPTIVGNRVTIGHSAVLHGCTVGDGCLIGMGAIVMDRAVIGPNCVVGAGALVTPGTEIPEGHLAVGSPAQVKRKLSDKELEWISSSADHYVELSARYLAESE